MNKKGKKNSRRGEDEGKVEVEEKEKKEKEEEQNHLKGERGCELSA